MNWKHLLWIIPLALITGLVFGFASSVYISIPEKVTIEMGYTPETLNLIEKNCNVTLPEISEPQTFVFKTSKADLGCCYPAECKRTEPCNEECIYPVVCGVN